MLCVNIKKAKMNVNAKINGVNFNVFIVFQFLVKLMFSNGGLNDINLRCKYIN